MIDNNGITATDAEKRHIKFTVQAKSSHVQSFQSSKQSMSAYCRKNAIPISTFSGWVSKYGKKRQGTFVPVQNDIPSQVISTKQKATKSPQTQHIEIYRGDLKVVLPVMPNVRMTVDVIKEVLSCN